MLHAIKLCKRPNRWPSLLSSSASDTTTSVQVNYFALLNVPVKFDLNLTELKAKYKKLQRSVHPDKNVNKSLEEQLSAAEQSVAINSAYKCLKNQFCRAKHILRVNGKTFDETAQVSDLVFLGDMMDFNDNLETCEEYAQLLQFKVTNEEGIKVLFLLFEDSYKTGDLDEAMECLMKCSFLLRNRERIDEKFEDVL